VLEQLHRRAYRRLDLRDDETDRGGPRASHDLAGNGEGNDPTTESRTTS
jgi:hypothetical protein